MSIVSAEAALLHALFHGPGYGLELFQRVGRLSGGRLRLGPGNAYPALTRLARRRLVRSWLVPCGAGRPRRYFELTPAGIETVAQQRHVIDGLVQSRPVKPTPASQPREMADRIDECAELSELAASLREQVADRTRA